MRIRGRSLPVLGGSAPPPKMLGVFSGAVVSPPEELIRASHRTPTAMKTADKLLDAFLKNNPSSVAINIGSAARISYNHQNQSLLQPRSFAVSDEIFCLFKGTLENLPSLKHHYGLGKNASEVVLVMEAYRALRDRAPYPTNLMLAHLAGNFAFIVFDNVTSTVFAASDGDGKVPLFMGITADGYLAFSDDAEELRSACGKSLASFPPGCFLSTSTGLRSYEHPKNKVTALPAMEEEIWGTTFKVERPYLRARERSDT
ncbi:stem-specific protein TSJT1-like isoform X2 [Musa acuminata AAA Group]|uniref:stem-specific protein TSJT1-like isoform X2 n=1 Tax=Musa acuminata AAA Group TaxID=214697 RepID=UPI0031E02161